MLPLPLKRNVPPNSASSSTRMATTSPGSIARSTSQRSMPVKNPLRFEHQPARELRHRLDQHHFRRRRVIRGADVDAFDGLFVDAKRGGRRAERNLVREPREPGHALAFASASLASTYAASVEIERK